MRAKNDSKILIELGTKIRNLRVKKGYNQTEFANIIGKDQPSVNRLENGKINPGYLYLLQIQKGLGMSISDFFKQID